MGFNRAWARRFARETTCFRVQPHSRDPSHHLHTNLPARNHGALYDESSLQSSTLPISSEVKDPSTPFKMYLNKSKQQARASLRTSAHSDHALLKPKQAANVDVTTKSQLRFSSKTTSS